MESVIEIKVKEIRIITSVMIVENIKNIEKTSNEIDDLEDDNKIKKTKHFKLL